MSILRFRSILLLFLLCLAHPQTSHGAPDSVVTVGAMSGQLQVRRKGVKVVAPLSSGQSLFIGDVISTGSQSKASLLFPDGAQVRLNSNSSLEVTTPRRVRNGNLRLFRVIGGQIWARLRPGNAIETRTAILGVRGTEVLLDVAPDGATKLTVTDGSVDFYNDFGAVVVDQFQQSSARPGTAPSAPLTVQNGNFTLEWTLDLDRAVLPREKFFVSLDRKVAASEALRRAAIVARNPGQVVPLRDYGDALFDSGRYDEAAQQYAAGLQISPRDVELSTRAGYALLQAGRVKAAEKSFLLALNGNQRVPVLQTINFGSGEASGSDFSPFLASSRQPAAAPTLVGLSFLALVRDRPEQAQKTAQMAVAANAQLTEAHLALGVALLRQPGRLNESIEVFQNALQAPKSPFSYQAHAWLSLAYLGQDNHALARREGEKAVQLAPQSGLAHGNLALAYLFSGEAQKATREAALALELNPESVAARVALAQAALSSGDIDTASHVAAQAVALDPDLPQARYLLGVSDASRRDYRHAVRELEKATELAPDFLPAHSALARVYTLVGRNDDATQLLQAMLPRHRETDAVWGALGATYYEQGRYEQSAQSYQNALQKQPGSALYQAELARTLLGSNRLNAAIEAGRAAVALAPHVGQYHAILGQAYEFSSLPSQAEREFRTALSLDPQNALALTQLAYRYAGNDLRPAAAGFAQGFLLDPAIARQLLRGGTNFESSPSIGSGGAQGFALNHRQSGAGGKLQLFGTLKRNSEAEERRNADGKTLDLAENLTYQFSPRTNFYAQLRARRDNFGLPGARTSLDPDDRAELGYGQAQIAVRQRLGARHHLWAGLFANSSRNLTTDAGANSFFDAATRTNIARQKFTSRALEPEIRLDLSLNQAPRRAQNLVLGLAQTRTRFQSNRELGSGGANGNSSFRQTDSGLLAYAQMNQQFGSRLSLISQLRWQKLARDSEASVAFLGAAPLESTKNEARTQLLPGFLATFQATKRATLRFSFNQRTSDATTSNFAPTETLLTTERASLPFGTPQMLRLAQLDAESRVSDRGFLKLFLFRTSADQVQIGFSDLLGFGSGLRAAQAPGLQIGKWRGAGAGMRYEHQLGRHFFANAGAVVRRTQSQSAGQLASTFNGQSAPYEPNFLGNFDLNYRDVSGRKVGVRLRHNGAFYQDSPLALGRARFRPQTYVDVLLAKEFSLGSELFLDVSNLFNRSQIAFKDFPIGQRQVNFGVTRRF